MLCMKVCQNCYFYCHLSLTKMTIENLLKKKKKCYSLFLAILFNYTVSVKDYKIENRSSLNPIWEYLFCKIIFTNILFIDLILLNVWQVSVQIFLKTGDWLTSFSDSFTHVFRNSSSSISLLSPPPQLFTRSSKMLDIFKIFPTSTLLLSPLPNILTRSGNLPLWMTILYI